MHWTDLVHWWLTTPTTELIWISVGLSAQLLFSMRFLVQWMATEKARASIIPETFWYFSFFGGVLLFAYACYRLDPVFMLGQATGLVIYSRNLYFIWLSKRGLNPAPVGRSVMLKRGQSAMRRSAVRFLLIAVAAIGFYAAYVYGTGNFHTVIAGQLYRSGQPTAEQIAEWHHRYGIKTIINLRGPHPTKDWYQIERAMAQGFGINLIDYRLSSKRELTADQVEELLAILAKAKPPILIHCSGGSDRSGLVSALYVAGVAHGSEAYAELQLTPFYGHLPLWFMPSFAMDRSFETAEPRLGFPDS